MILAINYANKPYRKAQRLNRKTALRWGADRVICYTPEDIDTDFYKKNERILQAKRGNGYFLWKPYFLNKAYQELNEGDYLVYTDSGSIFVNRIQYLIDCMEKEQTDIMVFSLEQERLEKYWSKRDAFILMECDEVRYTDTPQSIATYAVLKKSEFVERFLKEDLKYAQDIRIISDQDNTQGSLNYEGFVAHRHDQTVWSLMSKKYGLKRFRDPSQFGMVNHYEKDVEARSNYPQIIDSHRLGNVGTLFGLRIQRNKYVLLLKHKIYLKKMNANKTSGN